jgi:uncharacterized membrane protein YdjX (TVP38/TMEM64 family)
MRRQSSLALIFKFYSISNKREMYRIDKRKTLKTIVNVIVLFLFVGFILYLSIRYTPEVISLFKRRQDVKDLIEAKGFLGVFIFIGFQVLQIVVAAIPGEAVQIAGGYMFGTFIGMLYLMIGVIIGSIVVFYASRLLGYGLVKKFVPEKNFSKLAFIINGEKSEIVMLVLFLIPGIPKDMITYIAGLTPVKPLKFLTIAIVGRFPALLASCYIGANLQKENYTIVIIVSAIAVFLFAGGLIFKDKIINKIKSLVVDTKK